MPLCTPLRPRFRPTSRPAVWAAVGAARAVAAALPLAIGAALGAASPVDAAVTIEDLVTLASPSQTAISRDGKQIAWVFTAGDLDANRERSRIWLWRQEGFESLKKLRRAITGAAAPLNYRAVTRPEDDAESPAFSFDERSLAFLAARGDDAETQVWVLPLDGGEAESRTSAPAGIDQFAWAPDGAIVYLTSEPWPDGTRQWREQREKAGYDADVVGQDRRPKAFWRVPPGGGEAKRLHLGGPGIEDFALSWSGTSVVYRDNGTGDPSHWNEIELYRLDLDGGEPARLTSRWGDEWDPQWSHDDGIVYFLAGADSMKSFSQVRVFAVPAAGGQEPAPLFTEMDRDIDTFRSLPGDNRLFAVVMDGAQTILCKLFPNTQAVQRLVDQPGRVRHLSVAEGGEDVAFVQEGPGQAPEVCRWQFNNRHFDRLTQENQDITARADAQHQVVSWTAPDGLALEGLLVTPPDSTQGEPLPTVVVLHGGPASTAYDTIRWAGLDALAGSGYAVFAPHFRGGMGYGAAFNVANYRDLGGADFGDVMSGVDHLIAEGIADAKQLGITGASYGGFLTNVAITSTDRFAAAVSEFGIASFVTDFANSNYRAFEHDYFGAYFWEEPELYERLSPLNRVDHVVTPTLIVHGATDTNTRPANSRELFSSLLEAGRAPVEFVVYPREGHGFHEPAHDIDAFQRTLAWFDRYARGRDPARIGREGSPVQKGNWSLLVRSTEAKEAIGAAEASWLVVDFVLTSSTPVDALDVALTGTPAPFRLVDADGQELTPVGVPVEWNGAPHLVFGENSVTLRGDPAEDSASWPFRVVFDRSQARPPARFRALDLPEVEITWTQLPTPSETEKSE